MPFNAALSWNVTAFPLQKQTMWAGHTKRSTNLTKQKIIIQCVLLFDGLFWFIISSVFFYGLMWMEYGKTENFVICKQKSTKITSIPKTKWIELTSKKNKFEFETFFITLLPTLNVKAKFTLLQFYLFFLGMDFLFLLYNEIYCNIYFCFFKDLSHNKLKANTNAVDSLQS